MKFPDYRFESIESYIGTKLIHEYNKNIIIFDGNNINENQYIHWYRFEENPLPLLDHKKSYCVVACKNYYNDHERFNYYFLQYFRFYWLYLDHIKDIKCDFFLVNLLYDTYTNKYNIPKSKDVLKFIELIQDEIDSLIRLQVIRLNSL